MQQTNSYSSVDLMFRAFSDRTRLRILCLIRKKEFCVRDIVNILEVPQPRISRHLAYLRKAGLVMVRKAGLWSYYCLAAAENPFHQKLLACLGNCLSEVPEIQADQARAAALKKEGGCCPASPTPLEVSCPPVQQGARACNLRA
jgi:ArsR family transcriptional regulator, arsenate/arsenite/antimonite-responsive transcriptional repressor